MKNCRKAAVAGLHPFQGPRKPVFAWKAWGLSGFLFFTGEQFGLIAAATWAGKPSWLSTALGGRVSGESGERFHQEPVRPALPGGASAGRPRGVTGLAGSLCWRVSSVSFDALGFPSSTCSLVWAGRNR